MDERMVELLKNAVLCFEKSYSPFCHEELSKMCVTADECRDLSHTISAIIQSYISEETMEYGQPRYIVSLMKTKNQIAKTRQIGVDFGMDHITFSGPALKFVVSATGQIREDVQFLSNLVRLDVLRQIVEPEEEIKC